MSAATTTKAKSKPAAKPAAKPEPTTAVKPTPVKQRIAEVVAELSATFGIHDDAAELRPHAGGVFVSLGLAEQILDRLDDLLASLNAATADAGKSIETEPTSSAAELAPSIFSELFRDFARTIVDELFAPGCYTGDPPSRLAPTMVRVSAQGANLSELSLDEARQVAAAAVAQFNHCATAAKIAAAAKLQGDPSTGHVSAAASPSTQTLAGSIVETLFARGGDRLTLTTNSGEHVATIVRGSAERLIAHVLSRYGEPRTAASAPSSASDWLRTLPAAIARDLAAADGLTRSAALSTALDRELRALSIAAKQPPAKAAAPLPAQKSFI